MNMHSLVNARQTIGYMEKSGANLSQSLKRLSTGIKVDTTDAGGLAVSTKMDSVITRTRTLGENVQNGVSFLESQDAAQSKLGAILTRMSELRVRYDDPTINTSDGANLNREFKELQDDVRALSKKKFNGISLFSSGSDADSKLVIGSDSVNPSNSRGITRNQFFKSILETQSSGGPVGASATTQATLGLFTDLTITPIGGQVADFTVKGLQGTAPAQVINGVTGTTPVQTVKGVATGTTTPDLTINAQQGTFSKTVNGEQGVTPDFTISGTIGAGVGATASVTTTGGTSPTTKWKTGAGGVPALPAGGTNGFDNFSPVSGSNGDIFVGKHEDDKILQLDANNGALVRTYDLGAGNKNMSWKVAVADTSGDGNTDTLYAANGDGKQLIAFDTSNGNVKAGWPVNLNTDPTQAWAITEAPPFVHSNGNVYVTSNGEGVPFGLSGKVYCLQSDGTALPSFTPLDVNGEFTGGFAEAADGTLILTGKGTGSTDRSVQAFHPDTGASLWTADHGSGGTRLGRVEGPPVIVGNSVVVNTGNRTDTTAFDIVTGNKTRWRNNNGRPDGGVVAGKNDGTDAVFAATSQGVAAIPVGGGTVLWTAGGDYETCTPAYDSTKNRLYLIDDNTGNVVALRTATEGGNAAGSEAWRIATGSASFSSPIIDSSGNIYVGNNNGDFIAITPPGMTLPAVNLGTGYTVAPPITDITLTQTSGGADVTGTLAVASVTLNGDTLDVTFSGTAAGAGIFDVKVASSTISPPAAVTKGTGYDPAETAPLARVIAEGIGDKSATLQTGLVALIDGNADPVGGTITDSSGTGNDGTVAAGQEPTRETTERRSGAGAYTFDGTNDKIHLGTLNGLISGQDKLTISAWVYHEASGDDRIVCKSPDTNVTSHIFNLGIGGTDKLKMRIGTTDPVPTTTIDGSITIPLKEWTHVAMTYDGTEVKSYVNGVLDSAATTSLTGNIKTSPDLVTIGNIHTKTGGAAEDRHFDGKLDDVGIWNRALSDTEIKEIAGPGNLTATTSVNDGTDPLKVAGTLTVTPTPTGTLATTGPFTVEVDDGVMRIPANFTTGITTTSELYDAPGDTVGSTLNISFAGADAGSLGATAKVKAGGQLDVTFSGAPSGTGNLTMTVDGGGFHLDDPIPLGSGYVSGETPAFTITGADSGTVTTGNATVNDGISGGPPPPAAGTLKVDLSTIQPTGTGNLILKIADGFKAPADLPGIGSNYVVGPPAETNPSVNITGADKGTLAGTATVQLDGSVNLTFTGFPTGPGDLTVTVANGVVQNPVEIPSIGTGYAAGETPAFTITDADISDSTLPGATITGNATVNDGISGGPPPPAAGTLKVDLSSILPTGTGNLNLTIASGAVQAPADLTGIGSGYTFGDTPPAITVVGANKGDLAATATINNGISGGPPPPAAGTLNINFTPGTKPTDTNNVTIQVANGLGRLTSLSGGSGYAASDNPAFTISGGGTNMTGFATPDGSGGLNVDLSNARPDDFTDRTLQIANGALQTPADINGIGAFHDPSVPPPAATISGTDVGGVTVNNVIVNPNGTVNVSFAGVPSGTGPLTVTVAGGSGTGSTGVSSNYLLDINGDLWDYSVSEFESFTELVSDARAQNGAEQNSLGTFWELLSTNVNKLEQAAGRIKDADFAKEMTEVSKSQINTRSAAVMLGKQNRITSEALLTLQNLSNML